ncbi:VOC family protein [Paenibacillus mesophilus]|uniref:VOC family protein n=1 Tax=Paenibacillus mesophilus TaxID=2582849 RepID=UPI00130513FB|nr:VOC family protein [Paenibacillus mesophilus]
MENALNSNFQNKRNSDGYKPQNIPKALKVIQGNFNEESREDGLPISENTANNIPFNQRIGNCYVHVYDFEKAYHFYTNILGLKPAWTSNDNNKPLAGFNMEIGTGFIIVGMPTKVTPLPYAAFHFQCTNVAEAHRYLREKGVQVTDISEDGHGFEFWDTEGNKLHTMSI